jgi:hypothetical protein
MIRNTAVPLGFIIAPRETKFTYAWVMEELWNRIESVIPEEAIPKKPVLSDQGQALIAFCESHGLEQFFCHRHIIEKYGARSAAGMFVAHILRIESKTEFDGLREQFTKDIEALLGRHLITQKAHDSLKRWLADYHDGIWERVDRGIARCSNHAERFHGVVNAAIKAEKVRTLTRRLGILQQQILAKFESYPDAWARQAAYALACLKGKRPDQRPGRKQTPVRPPVEPRTTCTDRHCLEYRRMMNTGIRLGFTDFPCEHTVHGYKPKPPDRPDLRNKKYERAINNHLGKPVRVTRSEVLSAFQGDQKARSELEKNLHPVVVNDPGPPERDFVDWEEERGAVPHRASAVAGCPCADVARTILAGIYGLRLRSKRWPNLDTLMATEVIIRHYKSQFAAQKFKDEPEDIERRMKWLSEYKAAWWYWAANNRDCPTTDELPLAPPDEGEALVEVEEFTIESIAAD